MALTRKMLKAMGIEEEKIDQIIDAHTETVDGLKEDLKTYKSDAEKLPGVQKELDAYKDAGDDGFEERYKTVKKEFDDYKAEQDAKEIRQAKEAAYKELLKEAGVSESRIATVLKLSNIDEIELKDGKVKDADKHIEGIKAEWKDVIVKTEVKGAPTANPPANVGGGAMTKDEIFAIQDLSERRAAISQNMNLFNKGD